MTGQKIFFKYRHEFSEALMTCRKHRLTYDEVRKKYKSGQVQPAQERRRQSVIELSSEAHDRTEKASIASPNKKGFRSVL